MQEGEDVAICPRTTAASFTVRTLEPWNQALPKSDRNGSRQAAPQSVEIDIFCHIFSKAVSGLNAGHPYSKSIEYMSVIPGV